jgi:hypothetical protein
MYAVTDLPIPSDPVSPSTNMVATVNTRPAPDEPISRDGTRL